MANDKKISEFTQQASLLSTDRFDLIRGSTNITVPASALPTFLGVTGTIVPVGAGTATPVLEQPGGNVNNIRGFEDGKGIQASISVLNGITLDHNFDNIGAGVNVIKDLTSIKTEFRSIIAGAGITVASTGDEIQIATSAVPASTKTVLINQASDFPTAAGGVITLVANTEYLLTNDISTSDRFVMADGTAVKGTESIVISFTYTGTGDMFTGVDSTNRIANLKITATTGRVVNWSTTLAKIFRMNDVTIVSCDKIALMNSASSLGVARFTNVSPATVTTDGVEITGAWNSFLYEVSAAAISAGAYFNLGTATFNSFVSDIILANLSAGANLISGAAASAYINAGG
ncbi:MAG: hypothetical protein V3T88_09085, partial [Nitrosomonadaceae bacterium]